MTSGIRHRRPRAGERTRGTVDALQTKIAVGVQNLEPGTYLEQLQGVVDEIPESTGADTAFIALIDNQGITFDVVLAASQGFAQCSPLLLQGEKLEDWPWLRERLGHLRIIEITETAGGPAVATDELGRLNELHIGSALVTGFALHGEISGVLGIANEQSIDAWDADLHLLMKLFGSSLAVGLERARDREILDELQERNSLVAMTANDGIWDFDGASRRINLSRRWKSMLGYDANEEDLMLDWYKLVHPDDIARVQTGMREHLAGNTPFFESVHRMKHQNGEWRWMKSRAKSVLDENGRLLRLLGVEVDITERKLYEDALFREKESAQITLQSIGDGVITTDASCTVEYVNPVAEELTGWKVDDASGRSIDDIFRGFHEETCEPLENPLGGRNPPGSRHQVGASNAVDSARWQ